MLSITLDNTTQSSSILDSQQSTNPVFDSESTIDSGSKGLPFNSLASRNETSIVKKVNKASEELTSEVNEVSQEMSIDCSLIEAIPPAILLLMSTGENTSNLNESINIANEESFVYQQSLNNNEILMQLFKNEQNETASIPNQLATLAANSPLSNFMEKRQTSSFSINHQLASFAANDQLSSFSKESQLPNFMINSGMNENAGTTNITLLLNQSSQEQNMLMSLSNKDETNHVQLNALQDSNNLISSTFKLSGERSEQMQQLQKVLCEQLHIQASQQIKQAVIRLDPPELGNLNIELMLNTGKLQVQIKVNQMETYHSLQQMRNELKNYLADQHFAQVEVQIAYSNEQSAKQQQARQQQDDGANKPILAADEIMINNDKTTIDNSILTTV